MVGCRSCGRNITSGTIRCTGCGAPFHLSCSHRYKISPDGLFNICCGSSRGGIPPLIYPGTLYPTRNRRGNKRRQTTANNLNASFGNNRKNHESPQNQPQPQTQPQPQQPKEDGPMRYGKLQKIESNNMVANEKPATEEPSCNEVIQEDFTVNENDNDNNINEEDHNDVEVGSHESITILDNEDETSATIPTQIQNMNLNSQDKDNITLETVWEGISSLQSSISNISNSLDTVSNHLNTFDPRINELETTLNAIKDKTSNFENVQSDVSGLKDELTRITSELEEIKTAQTEKGVSASEILMEIREREMKSKNILIYNVAEDNLRISQDYSTVEDIDKFNALVASRDTSRAREILGNIPNIDLDEIVTRRLGRTRPNYCRPLRVTLSSKDDVITIMKKKALVNNQFTIKTDLTRHQQKKIKELKEEIEKINVDKAKPTMTIKFINGEPQIIPIASSYFKRE